jgi:polysaccharide biosynthesis protein PslH
VTLLLEIGLRSYLMKLLFVVPYIPNQIRVRSYQWIRTLLNRGHDVTLLAVWTSEEEQADMECLSKIGVHVYAQRLPTWRSLGNSLMAFATGMSLQSVYSWHEGLAKKLPILIEELKPDVIHVEHLRGANYGLYANSYLAQCREKKRGAPQVHTPVVWDSVDCISHLFQQAAQQSSSRKGRLMTQLELNRTRRYEGWLVHQFDQVIVTSPTDREALEQLAKASANQKGQNGTSHNDELVHKLNVIPNGVDLAYFVPNGTIHKAAQIVFSGKMSYHANVTAAIHLVKDIMPRVWVQRPDAQVCIVGKDPTPEVRALASQSGARERRVDVTGTVPDLRSYLQKATVAVAPIPYGAGIQNKVLEAMACGAPVVASPQAVSALKAKAGQDLQVASDSIKFADAIIDLLDHPDRRYEVGRMGRMYVEQNHSWEYAGNCLEAVYRKALSAQGIGQ